MKKKTSYTDIDKLSLKLSLVKELKKRFKPGPWHDEPDEVRYQERGFNCYILRNIYGALCGYVEIPSSHPFYERDCDNDLEEEIEVHGGLSFSGEIEGLEGWFIGFDCGLLNDVLPSLIISKDDKPRDMNDEKLRQILSRIDSSRIPEPTYKDIDFVKKEISSMIDQLLEIK